MPIHKITEHRSRTIKEMLLMRADDPEQALRLCPLSLLKKVSAVCHALKGMVPFGECGKFIDDGLGGGALIDPFDDDHCLRADPRYGISDETETEEPEGDDDDHA